MTPLFRCQRGKSELVSLSRDCDRAGQLKAVLGYSWEPSHRDARPLFACQSAAEVFPSFDPKCEGQKQLAQLGYALPKAP